MRDSKINDTWRHLDNIAMFKTRIRSIFLRNISGFSEITIEPTSAITSICGKNGVGKTTLLKFIYNIIHTDSELPSEKRFGNYEFKIDALNNNVNVCFEKNGRQGSIDNVYYLDPTKECAKILSFISQTSNFFELLEGVSDSKQLNNDKIKPLIEKAIGKKYNYIHFKEIESALGDDYIFPYFEVKTTNGIIYNNEDMGMGELSALYIIWFMTYCENYSFIFLEEPENYISAYTQQYLMDIIASLVERKKIWMFLSTHSEHILSKLKLEHTRILHKKYSDITHLIEPRYRSKYLSALGLFLPIKGLIFVEDIFAEMFLTFILVKYIPEFLKEHKIIQLRCDSNIEKIIKHYEPQVSAPYNMIGIFDADQKPKISSLLGKHMYTSALPSQNPCPPEETIWDLFVNNIETIATNLNISQDELEDIIEEVSLDNYHDRYSKIKEKTNKSLEAILECVFSLWINDDENKKIAQLFCNAITTYDNGVVCHKITNEENGITITSGENLYSIKNENIHSQKELRIGQRVKVYFNGSELIL